MGKLKASPAKKRQIKRIRGLQSKWLTALGLRWWNRVEFLYYWHEDVDMFHHGDGLTSPMMTKVDWARQWAEIYVYLPDCEHLDDKELEHIFLHEMLHILVEEMKHKGQHHVEHVATRLALVLKWVYAAGVREGARKGKGK